MPSPKSGKAGSAVSPADPAQADEADKADPGEVEKVKAEQVKKQSGKYGAVKTKPFKGPDAESADAAASADSEAEEEKKKELSWVEIELVDEDDQPMPGFVYRITLPDGSVADGTLDEKGFARIEGFDSGECKVAFPTLDKDAWEKL